MLPNYFSTNVPMIYFIDKQEFDLIKNYESVRNRTPQLGNRTVDLKMLLTSLRKVFMH
jgi:hypothetical protein